MSGSVGSCQDCHVISGQTINKMMNYTVRRPLLDAVSQELFGIYLSNLAYKNIFVWTILKLP